MPDVDLVEADEMDSPVSDTFVEIPNVDLSQHAPTDDMNIQTETSVDGPRFMNKLSCTTGIERWDWKSNSLKRYNNVLRKGTVDYVDPGFPADDSSLFWEGWGEVSNVPRGMAWKRPKEMGQGWTETPSLFGKGK
jgi:hypothetical protein